MLALEEAPSSGPQTSQDAAEQIAPNAAALRERVFNFICEQPEGATDEEIQQALGMSGNTQRPRRWELGKKHLITDSGKVRVTSSGRKAIVWMPT